MNSLFRTADELKDVVPPMHRNMDFREIESMSIQAARRHLLPHIGQEQYDAIADGHHAGTLAGKDAELLPYAQRAVGWFTYMILHDTHAVNFSAQGLQESYSDDGTSRPASNWAKFDSKAAAANFADEYLEALLEFMEKTVADDDQEFTEWQANYAYQKFYKCFIWTSTQLGEHLFGGGKRRILHDLLPALMHVQENTICPLLGSTLYDALLAAMAAHTLSDEQNALLKRIRAYLAPKSMLDSIPVFRVEVDGGIWFRTYDGPASQAKKSATDAAVRALESRMKTQADGAHTSLVNFLDANAENYAGYEKSALGKGEIDARNKPTRKKGGVFL